MQEGCHRGARPVNLPRHAGDHRKRPIGHCGSALGQPDRERPIGYARALGGSAVVIRRRVDPLLISGSHGRGHLAHRSDHLLRRLEPRRERGCVCRDVRVRGAGRGQLTLGLSMCAAGRRERAQLERGQRASQVKERGLAGATEGEHGFRRIGRGPESVCRLSEVGGPEVDRRSGRRTGSAPWTRPELPQFAYRTLEQRHRAIEVTGSGLELRRRVHLVSVVERRGPAPSRLACRLELTFELGQCIVGDASAGDRAVIVGLRRRLAAGDRIRRAEREDGGGRHDGHEAEHDRQDPAKSTVPGWLRLRGRAGAGAYHRPMVERGSLRVLPKAEVHQHLDGALRPATAVELAAEIGMELTPDEARARLVAPARCDSQAELLRFFDLPIALLQSAGALRRVARELVETMAEDGVAYAEIRWAPLLHTARGLSAQEVIAAVAAGVEEARREPGAAVPLVALISTAMRSHDPAANVALAEAAIGVGWPLVGFDLAGPEADFPASPHRRAFEIAHRGGLALTGHAGEVPGSERVSELLSLGVSRIAHGVTVASDAALVDAVRERDVTLDMCPTSNVQAGIVPAFADHPFAALHRAGVSVTISTDDRTVSDTTLTEELERCLALGVVTRGEMADIAVNGFARGFAPAALRAPLIDAARSAWRAWAGTVTP